MKTATLIKDNLEAFRGHAALYKLSEPLKDEPWEDEDVLEYEYVIVSTAYTFGVETYIFPSNKEGEVVNWGELPGSCKGISSHDEALSRAGYSIISKELVE